MIEAQVVKRRPERMRIEQGKPNRVVAVCRLFEKRAGVVNHHVHPRRIVGMLRMKFPAEGIDLWVDLDAIDLVDPVTQGGGGVISRAGSDNEKTVDVALESEWEIVVAPLRVMQVEHLGMQPQKWLGQIQQELEARIVNRQLVALLDTVRSFRNQIG